MRLTCANEHQKESNRLFSGNLQVRKEGRLAQSVPFLEMSVPVTKGTQGGKQSNSVSYK